MMMALRSDRPLFFLASFCVAAAPVLAEMDAADGSGGSRVERPIGTEAIISILILSAIAALCQVGMYLYESKTQCRAEVLKKDMSENLSTDKYLKRILNNFSLTQVEDHIFHGIYPKKEKVSIRFKNISASIKGHSNCLGTTKEKKIITGVSGEFAAGHVSAILGTSGAGKTTFLNVLSGKIQARKNWEVSGNIYVNDEEADLSSLKSSMGFVPQEDIVHDRLTVRENIAFSAQMRNGSRTSASRIRRITDDVLQVLQLEAQQNTIVGNRSTGEGLSGGQRKRVNVGIELAACPTLLFLDEPTSGLDATGSLMLVKQLQKMTQLGMTIVMVIHQPRYGLFTLIDDVLLLGKGGRTVYIGPTSSAKGYFESLGFTRPRNDNPADWMMDVASGQHEIENARIPKEELPERLFEEWEKHREEVQGEQPEVKRTKTEFSGDCDVIKSHLVAAWRQVDPSGTATLGGEEFAKVLQHCTGIKPDLHVVHQLIARSHLCHLNPARSRLGGHGHTTPQTQKSTQDGLSLKEFQHYLLAVHEGGAALQQTERTPMPDIDEESPEISECTCDGDSSSAESSDDEFRPEVKRSRSRNDLHRQLPGFWTQLAVVIKMRSTVWWRRQHLRLMFLSVVVFAAVFLGGFDRYVFQSPDWIPTTFMNALISLSLLTSVYSLATFGSADELPMYWREVTHGLSRRAHFIGRSVVDVLDIFLLCFTFVTVYYLVTSPLVQFRYYVVPFFFVSFVASGWGYLISCWLPYDLISLGPFIAALLCFVFGGILGLPNEMNIFLGHPLYELVVGTVSFTRWGVPMLFFEYTRLHPQSVEEMSLRNRYTYQLTDEDYRLADMILPGDGNFWYTGILALTIMGCVLRFIAFLGLRFTNQSRQV